MSTLSDSEKARLALAKRLVNNHLRHWPTVRDAMFAEARAGVGMWSVEVLEGVDRNYRTAVATIAEMEGR